MGFMEAPFGIWFSQAKILLELIALLWGIAIVDIGLLNHAFLNAVIQKPRTLLGLFYYPFLSGLFHGDWDHLTVNTLYFLLFGGIIVLRDPTQLVMVTIVTAILSGLGIWLIGKGRGCGASGIIFGYLGFIVASAAIEKDLLSGVILAWLVFTFFSETVFFIMVATGIKTPLPLLLTESSGMRVKPFGALYLEKTIRFLGARIY
ncbi:MAG: rhomboid family intramembrane serine protease [Cyanobacteria bacterium]|nr:rhomboid family intramembrane serine protease [Cyanobacteriota bacterium]